MKRFVVDFEVHTATGVYDRPGQTDIRTDRIPATVGDTQEERDAAHLIARDLVLEQTVLRTGERIVVTAIRPI